MGELVRWLGEQLDADRAALLRSRDGHDGPCINYEGQDPADYDDHDSCVLHLQAAKRTPYRDAEFGLREIDAKRRTLIRCEEAMLSASPMLVHFAKQTVWEVAQPYAGRSGFREEWAP